MKMDPVLMHYLFSLFSAFMQMVATILMLFCVVNSFSFKSGASLKAVFFTILYFFSSAILVYAGSLWLSDVNVRAHLEMSAGIVSLSQALLIHVSYGLLIFALYSRTFISEIKR